MLPDVESVKIYVDKLFIDNGKQKSNDNITVLADTPKTIIVSWVSILCIVLHRSGLK